MKKIICTLLALTMVLAMAGTALAADVSASYSNGQLTVSTSTDGWFRISVDGQGTDRSLTPRVPTLTFAYELKDGKHRVSISSDIVGSGSTTIEVKNGKSVDSDSSAQPDPTQAPVAKEHTEHEAEKIPGVPPTCTKEGLTEGERCKIGGEILKAQEKVPALGHFYMLTSRANGKVTYCCSRCGDTIKARPTEAIKNRLGSGLLKDATGSSVDYTANAAKDNPTMVQIKADLSKKPASEIGLYLNTAAIMTFVREGFNTVEFINGKADLTIDLYAITPSWFDTQAPISCYVISTDPAAAEGTLVKVEALVSEDETLEAVQYTGISLL